MSAGSLFAKGLSHAHRIAPRAAGYVHTNMFVHTRENGRSPEVLCPLGAHRVELEDVPRVAAAYTWGRGEPSVLALHGWGADSSTMSTVVDVAVRNAESAMCFDAPGHGASPGAHATISEYAQATQAVLQAFPGIRTIVAHSLSAIAAVSAVAKCDGTNVADLVLLAPACSLTGVLERWASQRRLPTGLVHQIERELARRDGGVSIAHWDIRTLGLPTSVRVRLLHDPTDDVVPVHDSHRIAAHVSADVQELSGPGHYRILGCDEMRAALTACLA